MHMADALLSAPVGAALWLASGAMLGHCSRRIRSGLEGHLVPLMGVLGAFVFAAQMINFTIPATGSSGHIGGGLLLSILLGPHAAFVVIASVLTVQALFFADGGLLALGANIFNLGVFPCFVGWLLVYKPLLGAQPLACSPRRITLATVLAAVVGLQLGSLGVVLETRASGISSLPFGSFLLLMQPIHLAIGLVEGLATAALLLFMRRARPDLFMPDAAPTPRSLKPLLLALGLGVALTAGVFSWFASTQPDGLEWSLARASGTESLTAPPSGLHAALARMQARSAWLADYQLPLPTSRPTPKKEDAAGTWPAVDSGASLAGLIGALATLSVVLALVRLLRRGRGAP